MLVHEPYCRICYACSIVHWICVQGGWQPAIGRYGVKADHNVDYGIFGCYGLHCGISEISGELSDSRGKEACCVFCLRVGETIHGAISSDVRHSHELICSFHFRHRYCTRNNGDTTNCHAHFQEIIREGYHNPHVLLNDGL